MCLGVVAKVLEVKEGEGGLKVAKVLAGGVEVEVDATIVNNLKVGDYVIIHAGIIISKLSVEEAKAMIEELNKLLKLMESA
ncbi:MAG TPA: HypC/HybG/HupF family hydrogenase formation chaperone [Acidilobales archaeon]|nr:MAG: hypothetical protein B6U85_10335 [Desulfurococcales archaeon ex4484_42]HDD26723.1 HypC/HybG/HupF family hydrogenase formation chaperone [Acidilobales archaeon]